MQSLPTAPELEAPTGVRLLLLRWSERTLRRLVAAGAVGVGLSGVGFVFAPNPNIRASLAQAALLLATAVATVVCSSLALGATVWRGTRWFAVAIPAVGLLEVIWAISGNLGDRVASSALFTGVTGMLLAIFLGALVIDIMEHIRRRRPQVVSDISLMAAVTGGAAYLLLREGGDWSGSIWQVSITVVIAGGAVVLVAGWGVLAMWVPTRVHMGLFASAVLMSISAMGLAHARHLAESFGPLAGSEIVAGAALVAVAAVLIAEPRLNAGPSRSPRALWGIRPGLLALSLCGACGVLVFVLASARVHQPALDGMLLAIAVFGAVGVRTLMNQVEMARTTKALEGALEAREAALSSLRSATEVVTASEARHRLLLDAAVDGLVELDSDRMIVRANEAFASMVGLRLEEIVDKIWGEMVARSPFDQGSLANLPETGEAELTTDRGTAYLEARSSIIPTTPEGTLLLIRDVTPRKVAEQTIRTLFKFLQDRDEDRSRLLKRSNSAIEAERNRIARDLHDGPIQGISAAALSLEAVKLMIDAGDVRRGTETLQIIVAELSEEAMNLRRIMSDLRPPVLEQRGLIPAVRELCARSHRELQIPVSVVAVPNSAVPSDVETLAYRVIQEALSNITKHAKATRVEIRIVAASGTLQVEVTDDGGGFDTTDAREFLRDGKVGLASMRERAELAGGTFTVRSTTGSGTTVMAELPFELLPNISTT
jgi:PAS domain S-box-containing protein